MKVIKAERTTIKVAGSEVEVFMLPNGEYRYSNTSATKAIGVRNQDLPKYISRTNPEAANGSELLSVGSTRVKGLTEAAVSAYWQWKASNGNKEAQALVTALTAEALTRRADAAFGQVKSEEQYEEDTAGLRLSLIRKLMADYVPYGDDIYTLNRFEAPPELTPLETYLAEDLAYLKKWIHLRDAQPECAEGYNHIIEQRSKMVESSYGIEPSHIL